jgi:toxin-antitoxin system PIN domain toxin
VILIDANLLLYAYHPASARHTAARQWLEETFTSEPVVRLAWTTLWAFLRIATSARVFERPLSASEAVAVATSWLDLPNVDVLEPGDRHWRILGGLLVDAQCTGPLVMDAALAALAIEHGAVLCTTDRDFSRFPKLETRDPLSG